MLKNIKSAVIFHFIYKMRRKLIIIASMLISLFIFTLIIDDIFSYMIANNMKKETLFKKMGSIRIFQNIKYQ